MTRRGMSVGFRLDMEITFQAETHLLGGFLRRILERRQMIG